MKNARKKVFVAMSGGVDSSVAAVLLKEQGYAVVGAHMKCYNIDGCAERDAEDARRVAEQLHIPFYTFDFEQEYKDRVVNYMVDGYRAGSTPNPDVMCNKEIKFGLFLKRALELGADYIATGHYVKIRVADVISSTRSAFSLITAKDKNKDQSYFLWTLTQQQLQHCLFPIGDYNKPQVRNMAKKFGLLTADKKDSQGICFLGQVTLADFLKQYIPAERGAVMNTAGKKIGEHQGAELYTIGQRHGFTIMNGSKPHYIAHKNTASNTLIAAEGNKNPALYAKEITLIDVNFINPLPLTTPLSVMARVRYRQPPASAKLYLLKTKNCKLVFARRQKFIAPGQSAVFYDTKGRVLGGGIIA